MITFAQIVSEKLGLINVHMHNKKLNDMYSPSVVRVIKSRRMRWVGHVACMMESRVIQCFDGET
jgi:hypothetical protein